MGLQLGGQICWLDDQRRTAYRFGVNLLVYALTGTYKADQAKVPAMLERLGR